MIILEGIKNFLNFLNDNWVMIATIVLLALALIKKFLDFRGKSTEEKIEVIKKQIQQSMLKFVTEAEIDYQEWISAGEIKRSQVINQIFEKYPILSSVTNQEDLIVWMDKMIDNALETMRDIFEENENMSGNESETELEAV